MGYLGLPLGVHLKNENIVLFVCVCTKRKVELINEMRWLSSKMEVIVPQVMARGNRENETFCQDMFGLICERSNNHKMMLSPCERG